MTKASSSIQESDMPQNAPPCTAPPSAGNAPQSSTPPTSTGLSRNLFAWFLFSLLLLALYLSYQLFAPFLQTFILAAVFSASAYPFYNKLKARLRGHAMIAAFIMTLAFFVLVGVPVTIFLIALIPQAINSISSITVWLANFDTVAFTSQPTVAMVLDWIGENLPIIDVGDFDAKATLLQLSRTAGQTLLQLGTRAVGDILHLVAHYMLMLVCMFFMFKDGYWMLQRARALCPLRASQQERIISELRKVGRSVLVGGLLVAVIQGFLGGVGLAIIGIPPLFWGTLMGFASLIPVVGTGLVWVPTLGYLLIMSQWESAIFFALWCGIVVVGADSILRPYFMRGGAGMSVFFIFLSILGGVQAFGMLGILYGPLILSFTVVMLALYSEEYREILKASVFKVGEKVPEIVSDKEPEKLFDKTDA